MIQKSIMDLPAVVLLPFADRPQRCSFCNFEIFNFPPPSVTRHTTTPVTSCQSASHTRETWTNFVLLLSTNPLLLSVAPTGSAHPTYFCTSHTTIADYHTFTFLRDKMASKALLAVFALCQAIPFASACDGDVECQGVQVCEAGACVAPVDCGLDVVEPTTKKVQIRGNRCRVTLDLIMEADPDAVTKEGTVYTINKKLWIRDGAVVEIHGGSDASPVVSELRLKV